MPARSKHTKPAARKPKQGRTAKSCASARMPQPKPQVATLRIDPASIPRGKRTEQIAKRREIIKEFYKAWREQKDRVFNADLNDYILVNSLSATETAQHAAQNYLSTLAVIQLDVVLAGARKIEETIPNSRKANQTAFDKLILMEHVLPGIGTVKLTVGMRRSDKAKVQYCITALKTGQASPKRDACLAAVCRAGVPPTDSPRERTYKGTSGDPVLTIRRKGKKK